MEARTHQQSTGGALKIADGIQPALDGLISAMAEHVASRAVYQLTGPSAEAALAKLQQAYVALNDACDKAQLQLEAERLKVIREQSMAADAKLAGAPGGELQRMQEIIQSQTAALFSELQKSAPPEALPPPEAAPAASLERSRTVAVPSSSLQEAAAAAAAAAADDDVVMVAAAPEETPAAEAQPQVDPPQGAAPAGPPDVTMAAAEAPGPDGAQQQLHQPSAAALATPMDTTTLAPAAPEAPPAPAAAQAAPAGDVSGTPATQAGSMGPPPPQQPSSISPFSAIQQHEPGSLTAAPSADAPLMELLTATSVPTPGTTAEQPAPAASDGTAAAPASAQAGNAAPDEFMLSRMESLPQLPSMDMEGFLDL